MCAACSTGHSLGGGIAKIVSAGTGVPVVAVSSPGIFLSSKGFNVPAEPLAFLETNLITENDLIPKIDRLQVSRRAGRQGLKRRRTVTVAGRVRGPVGQALTD